MMITNVLEEPTSSRLWDGGGTLLPNIGKCPQEEDNLYGYHHENRNLKIQ
jgi:hypothetical protein